MAPRRRIGQALLVICVVGAVAQWWYIVLKARLFVVDYQCQLYVNHVGADVFVLAYVMNAFLLLFGLGGVLLLRDGSVRVKTFALIPLAANVLGWISFFLMHRCGMLVTYEEFIYHAKGALP